MGFPAFGPGIKATNKQNEILEEFDKAMSTIDEPVKTVALSNTLKGLPVKSREITEAASRSKNLRVPPSKSIGNIIQSIFGGGSTEGSYPALDPSMAMGLANEVHSYKDRYNAAATGVGSKGLNQDMLEKWEAGVGIDSNFYDTIRKEAEYNRSQAFKLAKAENDKRVKNGGAATVSPNEYYNYYGLDYFDTDFLNKYIHAFLKAHKNR